MVPKPWVGLALIVSLPHKVAIIKHLDKLGESAQLIGAVNTVVKQWGTWIVENTDGKGFLQALKKHINPENKQVTLFGAGGAARAIAVELALAGVSSITIVNRSKERAQAVVALLNNNTTAKAIYQPWSKRYAIAPKYRYCN